MFASFVFPSRDFSPNRRTQHAKSSTFYYHPFSLLLPLHSEILLSYCTIPELALMMATPIRSAFAYKQHTHISSFQNIYSINRIEAEKICKAVVDARVGYTLSIITDDVLLCCASSVLWVCAHVKTVTFTINFR